MNFLLNGRFFILITLLVTLASCNHPAKKIRVGYSNRPYSAFIHLASEHHFFSNVETLYDFPSSTSTMQAFQAGKIDLAFLSMDQAITMLSQSIDFKIISVIDKSIGGDGLVVAPYIKNVEMLKNSKIGFERNASGVLVFSNFIQKHPKYFNRTNAFEISQNAIINAFKQGKLNAVIVTDPVKQTLINDGAIELLNSKQMQQPITYLLIAHTNILKSNRKSVLDVLTGFYLAEQLYNRDKSGCLTLMSKQMQTSEDKLKQMLGHFYFYTSQKSLVHLSGAPSQIEIELRALSQYMFYRDILTKSTLNYNNMIDTSLLKEILYD
ncbi:MAG: ABC transporter substrate-binding protein [Psychromonas sp.]|nr:ABC transporter substrate-binding protein [Psychromonas sp.]